MSRYADTKLTAAQALTWAAAFHEVDPTKVGRVVATGGFGWSKDRQSIVIPSAQSRAAFVRFRSGRLQGYISDARATATRGNGTCVTHGARVTFV